MPNEDVPSSFVVREVIRGSEFWQVGLRSLYFSTILLLWIFGPIPMLLGSVTMVAVLINLDRNTTPLEGTISGLHISSNCSSNDVGVSSFPSSQMHLSTKQLQSELKDRGQAISVMSSTLSASTSLASISLGLSSLIGAWTGNSYNHDYIKSSIYGNNSDVIIYVKYIAILVFFMIAFFCFVQTAKCIIHANFLLSFPNSEMPVNIAESAVITGSNFWVVGLRSLFFATVLLLWIFGPLPLFVCAIVTVIMLYYNDKNTAPLHQYGKSASHDPVKNETATVGH